MYRKIISSIMIICMVISTFSGCADNSTQNNESLTAQEQLIELAQAEGQIVVYSITSRMETAALLFEEKYGIEVIYEVLNGGELIARVNAEVSDGTYGADLVLAQDSGAIQMELIASGMLVNYLPENVSDYINEEDQYPLVHQYINKVFMINGNAEDVDSINNVWQLTEEQYAGKIYFKDPFEEDVNLNFLTMLTAADWAEKLEVYYEELYGEELILSDGCANAGYEWIYRMAKNVDFIENDVIISNLVGDENGDSDLVGLFSYSKTRYADESGLSLLPLINLEPFSGFMYPVYIMMTSNAQNTYASQLFIEFVMQEEGYYPWSIDVGAYSPNSEIGIVEGDYTLDYWKEHLVMEDAIYTSQNLSKVTAFVTSLIEKYS